MNQFLFASFLCYLLLFCLSFFTSLYSFVSGRRGRRPLPVDCFYQINCRFAGRRGRRPLPVDCLCQKNCRFRDTRELIPYKVLHNSAFCTLHFYPALYLHSYPASTTAAIRVLTETLERASTTAFLLSRSTDTAETPLTPSSAF